MSALRRVPVVLAAVILPALVSACSQTMDMTSGVASMVMPSSHRYSAREKECLMRAMFFESNRSSRDGLVAVGTVVMNRLRSGKHGNTICEVVGAKRQFAPGVMTRKMNSKALPDVEAAADSVLRGERHPKVKNAMFFHTAGLKFPYKNMHYVVVAGGNAFYEKRNRRGDPVVLPPEKAVFQPTVMMASAEPRTVVRTRAAPTTRSTAMTSSRGDGSRALARRLPAPQSMQPVDDRQPIAVAMAMDGPSPSAGMAAAAPFPDKPAVVTEPVMSPGQLDQTVEVPATPALPAVTEAVPTAESSTETALADGWVAGGPGMQSSADAPAMSFAVDADDADAIGAMIAGEGRPSQDM